MVSRSKYIAILSELQEAEAKARGISVEQLKNTWGGRGDIIGSPQNEATKLTSMQVLEIVKKHMRDVDGLQPPSDV